MILDRIIKSFWGRYVFYLSVFVAVYFLMRNAIDNALYGLGALLFGQLEGCHSAIAWIVLAFLVADPIYRKCTQKASVVNQPLFAFVLVPVSAWYSFQVLVPHIEKHIIFDLLYIFILLATLAYSSIIAFERSRRLRLSKKGSSFLLQDEPINGDNNDELGFTIYADSISSNIKDVVGNKRSFVFGIEGSWGSGKTSFINMVKARLKGHKEIRIVDFNPWMSSSSKQISSDFFKRMTEEVSDLHLKAKFREYGKLLAAADKTGIVEKVVDRISTSQDLGTMLESINYCIERQNLRFVVFIDDTDRLDKEELLAVFKLVRNTASFSNTVFVLTYDRDYVETVLEKYFDDKHTAKAYSDKIVNFQFELPNSAKDHYEILKEKINKSEFIKAHPDIRLNNDDLPKEITTLLDSYRKVKRVFNALVVESGLPHFEIVPVKYTLVFTYISYYQPEELALIRDTFNSTKSPLKSESRGAHLLRLIQESKGIYGPDFSYISGGVEKIQEKDKENEKRKKEQKEFNSSHPLLSFLLLRDEENNLFIRYLKFFLRSDSIHYMEYMDRYREYGVNGFKRIVLNLSNALEIIKRLIEIRDNFNETFYRKCADDAFDAFTRNNDKISIGPNDLEAHFELLLALALSTSNPLNSLGTALLLTNEYYEKYHNGNVRLLAILEKLDETNNSSIDPYIQHYIKFELKSRVYIKSDAYRHIIKQPRKYALFEFDKVVQSAIKHLENVIERNLPYEIVEDAFFACGGIGHEKLIKKGTKIDASACKLFREYIEKHPDDFIQNCIQNLGPILDYQPLISYHPFLMQIFDNSVVEVKKYFASIECMSRKSQFILSMINKYLDVYLSDKAQNSDFLEFRVQKEDYDSIFSYSEEEEKAEEQTAHLEPSLLATPTEVSK